MKEYSILHRPPELEPHYVVHFSFIPQISLFWNWGFLPPLQGFSWHILSPTDRMDKRKNIYYYFVILPTPSATCVVNYRVQKQNME